MYLTKKILAATSLSAQCWFTTVIHEKTYSSEENLSLEIHPPFQTFSWQSHHMPLYLGSNLWLLNSSQPALSLGISESSTIKKWNKGLEVRRQRCACSHPRLREHGTWSSSTHACEWWPLKINSDNYQTIWNRKLLNGAENQVVIQMERCWEWQAWGETMPTSNATLKKHVMLDTATKPLRTTLTVSGKIKGKV